MTRFKIFCLNGIKNKEETAIEDIVPMIIPKTTMLQKSLISPFAKNTTGIMAKIVVRDVPIVRGSVVLIAWFKRSLKLHCEVRLARILSYTITVSLTEYPTIVSSAAIVEIPNSILQILINAVESITS